MSSTRGGAKESEDMDKFINKVCANFVAQLEKRLMSKLQELDKKLSGVRDAMQKLKCSVTKHTDEIHKLELQIDNIDQRSKRNCFRLCGLVEEANEDLVLKVASFVSAQLSVQCSPEDIDYAVRIRSQKYWTFYSCEECRQRRIVPLFLIFPVRERKGRLAPIPRPQKALKQQTNKNLQSFETEETSKLTTQELQRLVLIEQLKTTRIQRQFYEQAIGKALAQPNASHDDNSYVTTQLN